MCGITGFVDKKNKFARKQRISIIESMLDSIEHRGRDDKGFYADGKIVIGHCRLSILDTSQAGKQPFFSLKKDKVLSYNGEIYNFLKLNEILKNDYKFKSSCDTETLLHAYEKWGIDSLIKLKGMFAFSLYDKNINSFFLAIDRFGIKPLYYLDNDEFFVFSSEIKAILKFPSVKVKINENVIGEQLLYRSISGGLTLIKNIKKLEPAHYFKLNIKTGKKKIKKYYSVKKRLIQEKSIKKDIVNLLFKSVGEHLIADVPVGLQLSGGVDSSLIAAIATQIKKQRFHTFSIGLKMAGWNEFKYSRQVAKKFKTKHHELYFNEKDFCELLPVLTYYLDEPINHPHSIPMYILSKYARDKVKVLISGEGADEVFFGYKRYAILFKDNSLNEKKIIESSQFLKISEAKKVFRGQLKNLYSFRKKITIKYKNLFDKLFYYDMATYLPPLLLRQDKMGMAANIENRVPFLDHEIVEYGYSLPLKYKLAKNETKKIIKEVAAQFFPKELVYRAKIGFGLPISSWLKNSNGLGKYLIFFSGQMAKRLFLDYNYINKVIAEHKSGEKDHGQLLWILISLEIWLQIFIDSKDYKTIYKNLWQMKLKN